MLGRLMYLGSFIEEVDLFQQPVRLMIKKNNSYKTMIGGIMSLTLLTAISVLLISSIIALSQKTSPIISQNQLFYNEPGAYVLSPTNYTLQFGIQSPSYITYIDESIFIVQASISQQWPSEYKNYLNSNGTAVYEDIDLPIVECSKKGIIQQPELYSYFQRFGLEGNYCIDWDRITNITVRGSFDSPNYEHIVLKFFTCSNATRRPDGPACKDQDTILRTLASNYLSVQMSSAQVNVQSFDVPFTQKGSDFYSIVSPKLYKEINVFLQPIEVTTDHGIIRNDIVTETSLREYSSSETIDLASSELFLSVSIVLTKPAIQYVRTYAKLQTILGEIGGLFNVLFTIGAVLTIPLNSLQLKLRLINQLFNFENPDEPKTNHSLERQKAVIGSRGSQLQDIIKKNLELKKSAGLGALVRKKLTNQLSDQIRAYFKNTKQGISFRFSEIIGCFRFRNARIKKQQFDYSIGKIEKNLDIVYIIKKLNEIDKLKAILLNKSQIEVFDYLPKPTITKNPENQIEDQYCSLLKQKKHNAAQAQAAKFAFQMLLAQKDDKISQALVRLIDPNVADLFRLSLDQNQELDLNTPGVAINSDEEFNVPMTTEKAQKVTSFQLTNRRDALIRIDY